MLDVVVRGAAVLLALLFTWAAVAKIIRLRAWWSSLEGYALPRPVRYLGVAGVPVLEGAIVGLVLIDELPPAGALALVAVSVFSLAILRRRSMEGDRIPCGCFGRATTRDYRVMLARNLLIAVPAAVVLMGGSGVSVFDGLRTPRPGDWLPAALVLAGVALITWMVAQTSHSLRRKVTR
ncbi:MAG: MauE/DoxX family redox-associated membrane protein [Actinomycetota bacterium]